MKWFKHDSDARNDSKLLKLRNKYGIEGYGFYFFVLECIAAPVEKHNLSFTLEEDRDLLAIITGIEVDRVNEMLEFMVRIGLLGTDNDGQITCLKLGERTDEYTQKLLRKSR